MRHVLKQVLRHQGFPALFSVSLGLLSAICLWHAIRLPSQCEGFLVHHTAFRSVFFAAGLNGLLTTVTAGLGVGVALFFALSVLGLARRPWGLSCVRTAFVAAYALGLLVLFAVFRVTALMFDAKLHLDGQALDPVRLFFLRWEWLRPVLFLALGVGILHLVSWRRTVIRLYEGFSEAEENDPAPGDRILENLRSHGNDPRFRKSLIASVAAHVMVLAVIPWLLGRGCVEDYRIQQGSGNPVVTIVRVVKPKKKPVKRYLLNPNSAISFYVPQIEDSNLLEEVEQATELTYEADIAAALGRMGAGGGKTGGWPDGMKNAVVRFIRLEYAGEGWEDGMDAVSRADLNFLEEFNRVTGFKVATRPESHPINRLDDYSKGFAPPFVYMTGSGRIQAPERDIAILRRYLLDGGLLLADAGSPQFDQSFRAFAQALFPGEPLRVIADDDPLYQQPYLFPNGAPPLWHHGGHKAWGMKHGDRWCLYYHPGDLNDAWKTGHSGINSGLAKSSMHLGINIVYYAFTHYLEETRKHRK